MVQKVLLWVCLFELLGICVVGTRKRNAALTVCPTFRVCSKDQVAKSADGPNIKACLPYGALH